MTLFNEQIPFDAKEPDLIVEEDSYVLHDTSPAVNYQEVMEDFAMRCYLSKPDLAMSMGEPSHWFGGHNSWLTFCGCNSSTSGSINTIPTVLYCKNTVDSDSNFRKSILFWQNC